MEQIKIPEELFFNYVPFCPFMDTDAYKLAVRYMAETEIFDRGITTCRSPYDPTEAFLVKPWQRQWSAEFAKELRDSIGYSNIEEEIHRHSDYSAQKWVDEYYRLFGTSEDFND